jgi:hypothetical protein
MARVITADGMFIIAAASLGGYALGAFLTDGWVYFPVNVMASWVTLILVIINSEAR